jgi:hypothetical protein
MLSGFPRLRFSFVRKLPVKITLTRLFTNGLCVSKQDQFMGHLGENADGWTNANISAEN